MYQRSSSKFIKGKHASMTTSQWCFTLFYFLYLTILLPLKPCWSIHLKIFNLSHIYLQNRWKVISHKCRFLQTYCTKFIPSFYFIYCYGCMRQFFNLLCISVGICLNMHVYVWCLWEFYKVAWEFYQSKGNLHKIPAAS